MREREKERRMKEILFQKQTKRVRQKSQIYPDGKKEEFPENT